MPSFSQYTMRRGWTMGDGRVYGAAAMIKEPIAGIEREELLAKSRKAHQAKREVIAKEWERAAEEGGKEAQAKMAESTAAAVEATKRQPKSVLDQIDQPPSEAA